MDSLPPNQDIYSYIPSIPELLSFGAFLECNRTRWQYFFLEFVTCLKCAVSEKQASHQYFHPNVLIVLQRQCKLKRSIALLSLSLSVSQSITLSFCAESLRKAPTHFHLALPPVFSSAGLIAPLKPLISASSPLPHHRPLNAECLPPPAPALSLERLLMLTYHNFKVRFENCSFKRSRKVTILQG